MGQVAGGYGVSTAGSSLSRATSDVEMASQHILERRHLPSLQGALHVGLESAPPIGSGARVLRAPPDGDAVV